MTAFARGAGASGSWRLSWEVRSVNGKALDLRLRLPPGFDEVETRVRAYAGQALSRGSLSATLAATREGEHLTARINLGVLESLHDAACAAAAARGAPAPGLDALLGLKGIVDIVEAETGEAERAALIETAVAVFVAALDDLKAMRAREGEALRVVLEQRLDALEALANAAETLPERQIDAVRARLAEQVAALMDGPHGLDPQRLHQEAVLIATRADVREELDRLNAHIAASRALLKAGGPAGRRLDFLAQEFNREVNTLCSKSNGVALTRIGLDMKLLVDQFREQVQNLE